VREGRGWTAMHLRDEKSAPHYLATAAATAAAAAAAAATREKEDIGCSFFQERWKRGCFNAYLKPLFRVQRGNFSTSLVSKSSVD